MIFYDTWAWLALANPRDPYHAAARMMRMKLFSQRRVAVTTDYVLSEFISPLFSAVGAVQATTFVNRIWTAERAGTFRIVSITRDYFQRSWRMRLKYADKPDISFVDFTSMVVMQDLNITDIFTGDRHFERVGLGFTLHPRIA